MNEVHLLRLPSFVYIYNCEIKLANQGYLTVRLNC